MAPLAFLRLSTAPHPLPLSPGSSAQCLETHGLSNHVLSRWWNEGSKDHLSAAHRLQRGWPDAAF